MNGTTIGNMDLMETNKLQTSKPMRADQLVDQLNLKLKILVNQGEVIFFCGQLWFIIEVNK